MYFSLPKAHKARQEKSKEKTEKYACDNLKVINSKKIHVVNSNVVNLVIRLKIRIRTKMFK